MHHLLVNTLASAATATDQDIPAIGDDPSFTIRGSTNHWIFTEPYQIIAAYVLAGSAQRLRISSPTLDAFGQPHLWPMQRSLTPPSPANEIDSRDWPFPIPMDEEIKLLLTNNKGGAEQETIGLLIATPNWTQNYPLKGQGPSGQYLLDPNKQGFRFLVHTSQSVTLVANDWSGDVNLTFDQLPRGGWYGVVGALAFGTNLQFFRLNFPRFQLVNGRKFFPGAMGMAAYSDVHPLQLERRLGLWGIFHTFEPPKIGCFGTAGGAQTIEAWLDLVYYGPGSEKGPGPFQMT